MMLVLAVFFISIYQVGGVWCGTVIGVKANVFQKSKYNIRHLENSKNEYCLVLALVQKLESVSEITFNWFQVVEAKIC